MSTGTNEVPNEVRSKILRMNEADKDTMNSLMLRTSILSSVGLGLLITGISAVAFKEYLFEGIEKAAIAGVGVLYFLVTMLLGAAISLMIIMLCQNKFEKHFQSKLQSQRDESGLFKIYNVDGGKYYVKNLYDGSLYSDWAEGTKAVSLSDSNSITEPTNCRILIGKYGISIKPDFYHHLKFLVEYNQVMGGYTLLILTENEHNNLLMNETMHLETVDNFVGTAPEV